MRLGGPVPVGTADPDKWIAALKSRRYSAASSPVDDTDDEDLIKSVAAAAAAAGIVIAEVGAWSNPLSPDADQRRGAMAKCAKALWVAERMGALCCVNIAGSRSAQWDGPDPRNLTAETFHMVVETVRAIIDEVKPSRTFYTLEPMPWICPDSADSYLSLIKAVDRKQFAVHLDPVNMINSPQRFFYNADFLRECFEKLGPYIKCCHAKDITLSGKLTVHLDEARPGVGALDYRTYVKELEKLSPDAPLLLEHLKTDEDFDLAAAYVRGIAEQVGVRVK